MEILIQWIQKLIINSSDSRILCVDPPILSRAFQEISRGAVNFNQLRNFTEIPFPYPYAQMLSVMLVLFSFFTPVLAGICIKSGLLGVVLSTCAVVAFWGTNY